MGLVLLGTGDVIQPGATLFLLKEMFCFSRANHASTNLKKVFELKTRQVTNIIHGQVYFIYSFPRRLKLGKSLQTCCVILFPLSWPFNREKSVFWKTPFRITRTDYACKTW